MDTLIERKFFKPLATWLSHLPGLDRGIKRAIVLWVDGILCILAVWTAFSLRLGQWDLWSHGIGLTGGTALAIWYPVAFFSGIYKTIFRTASSGTMVRLAQAVGLLTIAMVIIFMLISVPGIPRTIALLQPLIFFVLLALSRIVARYILVDLSNLRGSKGERRIALIYGAGTAGQQLASSMRLEPNMTLAGFIDDDPNLHGQWVGRVQISHSRHLESVIAANSVTDVLLALPTASRARRKLLMQELQLHSVRVQSLPAMRDIVDGRISVSDLREVDIADLLGRDAVAPDPELMDRTIRGRVVVVTGAGGSIGSELCRQILPLRPACLVLVEQTEYFLYSIERDLTDAASVSGSKTRIVPELASVTDADMIERIMDRWKPDTVFHAAAYKHVPLVEANVISGTRNNVFGTLHTAAAAEKVGVKHFILVSTDKAVRPTNVMGCTKRVCELVLQALASNGSETVFSMVRFGNVLGSSGSVVPLFKQQIRDGGPVTVTDKRVTRYFMTIPEASQLVIQAGAMAEGGEVYVLDMGNPIRIVELARSMIKLSGLTIRDAANAEGDIEIVEIGLRPGEKLYEELLIGDDPQPTAHERIARIHEKFLPYSSLMAALRKLDGLLVAGDRAAVIELLVELVPEFRRNDNDKAKIPLQTSPPPLLTHPNEVRL